MSFLRILNLALLLLLCPSLILAQSNAVTSDAHSTFANRAAGQRPADLLSLPAAAQLTIDPGITWIELTSSIGQDAMYFGSALGTSGDTIAVGAPGYQYHNQYLSGAAFVFAKPKKGWNNMTETARLIPSDQGEISEFGWSLAISGDTVAVGVPGKEAVYIFEKPPGGWIDSHEIAKLKPSNGILGDAFGQAVAMSGDTVVVGARLATVGSNQYQGTAYVFVKPANGWTDMTETAQINETNGRYEDEFGSSVAIQNRTIVIGAIQPLFDVPGAAYVFVQPQAGWTDMTETAKLTPSDGGRSDQFGTSVAVDDATIVVSAPLTRLVKGSVYVFERPEHGWVNMTETAELRAPRSTSFGNSVAISGHKIIVGSSYFNYVNNGFVYTYLRPKGGWRSTSAFHAQLTINDGHTNEGFGGTVAFTSDTIVVGAPDAPVGVNYDRGKVLVFPSQE